MARLGRSQPFKPKYGLPVWRSIVQRISQTIPGLARIEKAVTQTIAGLSRITNVINSNILIPSGLIGYWKFDEPSWNGTSNEVVDSSGNGNHGTAVNAIISTSGKFQNAASFDGTNDAVNIYSSNFNSQYNGNEVTIAFWAKVSGVGVWSDAVTRRFFFFQVDANNAIRINKFSTTNVVQWAYTAGGTLKTVALTTAAPIDWMHIVITVSKSNDRMIAYFNGVQTGSNQTGLGTWAGSLTSTITNIGAGSSTGANAFSGFIDDFRVYSRELSSAEITALYNSSPGVTGVARIEKAVLRTITGLSRITNSTLQTVTGKARITASTLQTIPGVARITATVTRLVTGVARITTSVLQTITGKARIEKAVLKTAAGVARIQKSVTQVVTGLARITATTTQLITGKSRITNTTLRTITGKSSVVDTEQMTITGKAGIYGVTNQTISGKGMIIKPRWERSNPTTWYSKLLTSWKSSVNQNWYIRSTEP